MTKQEKAKKEEALKSFADGKPVDLLNLKLEDDEPKNDEADEEAATAEFETAKTEESLVTALGDTPELLEFVKAYPDVFDIPNEVKKLMKEGKSLLTAYREYENAQLKAELNALKQNKKNAATTPGSVGGNATGDEELDELLRVFNSVFKQ